MIGECGRILILASVLSAAIAGGIGESRAQEAGKDEWLARLDAEHPEPPDEVLSTFLSLVKASPLYEVADALRVEKVEPEIAAWAKEFRFAHRLDSEPFVDIIGEANYKSKDGTTFRLTDAMVKPGFGHQIHLLVLYVEPKEPPPEFEGAVGPDGKRIPIYDDDDDEIKPYGKQYRVTGLHLKDLRFDVMTYASVMHPAMKKLELHSVRDMPLGKVLEDLCKFADFDYAFDTRKVNEISVTQELKDRSVMQCLESAAGVGGYRVFYGTPNPRWHTEVSLGALAEYYFQRRHLGWSDPTITPAETPMDLLRQEVLEKAEEVKKKRYVVTLSGGD